MRVEDDRRKVSRIIAIANQKGGVGKTTTAINLGASLAMSGKRVFLVDLDPQGNASTGLGVDPQERGTTMYDVMVDNAPLRASSVETAVDGLMLATSATDLSSADVELVRLRQPTLRLRDAFRDLAGFPEAPDFVLIDCPPSLNLLTLNALAASHSTLIPVQCEFFALEGLSQLILTIRKIRESLNAGLRVEGVLLTMFDRRNNLSVQVEQDARENLGTLVYKTVIPRNVRLSEAPSHGIPIAKYDPRSTGNRAYRDLAAEFLNATALPAGQ